MDIEKLIEQLKYYGTTYAIGDSLGREIEGSDELMLNAATALSTLQAENKELRAAVDNWKKKYVETNGKWIKAENKWAGLDKAVRNGNVYRPMQEELNLTHEENQSLKDENEKLRAELKSKVDLVFQQAKELDRRHLLLQEQEAELEQVKRALAMMWFAYVNSDKETPHSYETDALEEAEHILGPWAKCMPKYLRRGPEEG